MALVVVLLVVLLVVSLGWLAVRAVQAAGALLDARSVVDRVQTAIDDRDTDTIVASVPAAQDATGRARSATSDPVWRLYEHAPWIGPQLRAVGTVSWALDDVTHDALPAVDAVAGLADGSALRRADGSIDVDALAAAAPRLHAAALATSAASDRVAGIDTEALVGPLADPVTQVRTALAKVDAQLAGADKVATLLPGMLGADGPRSYLFLALNSAELRSAGGIVGTVLQVAADDGHLSLGKERTTSELRALDEPVLPLTPAERELYGDQLGRWIQNASATPDFPRTAALITARWAADVGGHVDGVVATDPVAVKEVLGAVGKVRTGTGLTLEPSTFLRVLLSDTYRETANGPQADAVFSSVAGSIFGAVTSGKGTSQGLVAAVTEASSQGRVRVWSAHDDEQRVLAGTLVGGAFLSGAAPDATGVFLDDITTGKLDYYLRTTVGVECTASSRTATVRVTLAYDPPKDLADLPAYVLGTRPGEIPPGTLATRVVVYAPRGAELDSLTRDGDLVAGGQAVQDERSAVSTTAFLRAGETTTVSASVPVRNGRVTVWATPTLTAPGVAEHTCSG